MNAESIKIETDEDGFWLVVGYEPQRFRIDDPEALYDHVKAVIGPWLRERDMARLAFVCRDEDIDESGGYATTDPKHPRYHSIHAALYDQREGK